MKKKNTTVIYSIYDNIHNMIDNIYVLQKKGIHIYEVYTPFPIHGLEKVLLMKKTRLSYLSFIYGLFGAILSCILSWYTMIYDWPQDIGGKPPYSLYMNLPSFIPIIFELTIFCAAHFMCITYLFKCRLFPWSFPKNPDPRTTDDKFLIEFRPKTKIKKFLNNIKDIGAKEVIIKEILL
jgi:hypothetical protein